MRTVCKTAHGKRPYEQSRPANEGILHGSAHPVIAATWTRMHSWRFGKPGGNAQRAGSQLSRATRAMPKVHSHYENLKVARNAPDAVIRAAYRVLAQQYHPDVNPTPEATRIMSMLNTAWETLSDSKRRAEHDAWLERAEQAADSKSGAESEHRPPPPPPPPPPSPVPPTEPNAAEQAGPGPRSAGVPSTLNLTAKIMAGFILGAWALSNTFTSKSDAWTERQSYSPPPAVDRAVTEAPKPSAVTPTRTAAERAKDDKLADKYFADLVPEGAKTGGAQAPARKQQVSTAGLFDDLPDEPQRQGSPTQSIAVRWSPNGKPWPATASYLPGFARKAGGGLSKVTIDNSAGDADVYLKLCSAGYEKCNGLRHVFIPQGNRFTMTGLAAGEYDIRYRDLRSGELARSEPMSLQQIDEADGVRFSVVTLTLYTVRGGNTNFRSLSEDEF